MDGEIKSQEGLSKELEELRKKLAEAELVASKYSAAFDAANDGIFILDMERAHIIDVNERACEMFCYPKEELLNMSVYDLCINEGPYTREEAAKLIAKVADGEPNLFEWVVQDKAGRLFWIEINHRRAVIGNKYRILAVVRDISSRKQTEERLNRINETFLSLGPNAEDNINRLTALCGELMEADCALYNRLEKGMLYSCGQWNLPQGFKTADQAKGHICYDVVKQGTDDLLIVRNLLQTEYAKTDPNVTAHKLQTYIGRAVKFGGAYNGTLCTVYQHDFIPTDEDKMVMGIIASAIGIEEERGREQEALAESESRYRLSIDHTPVHLAAIDPSGKFILWNKFSETMFGYTKEEAIGRLTPLSLHESKKDADEVIHIATEKGIYDKQINLKHKDGHLFPAHLVVVPYRNGKGTIVAFYGFAEDITERKKAEEDIIRRELQLEVLSRTSQHINTVLDIPVITRTLVAAAMELVGAKGGTAGLFIDDKMVFKEYNKNGKIIVIDYTFEKGYGIPGWVLNTLKPYFTNDAEHDTNIIPELRKKFAIYNFANVPILNGKGELLGCLELHNKEMSAFNSQDIFMLQGLAASAAIALENANVISACKTAERRAERLNKELVKINAKLKRLALRDVQTGLYNYHYLEEFIELELYRAKRYDHPFAVMMLDIDYFKSINDVYGHDFGDFILKQFAAYLKRIVRRYDIVVRFGGEEFVIISPGASRAKALLLARRILDAVNVYQFGNAKHEIRLKLSVAVVSYPEDRAMKGMDLIDVCDKILTKAKVDGGNRVYSYFELRGKKQPSIEAIIETENVKELKKRIEKLTKRGKESTIEAIFAFARTIELRDHYTGEHVENTVHYATSISRAIGLEPEEIENIRQAAVLHDLGKIGISDKILLKKAKLTKKEFEEIKKHPQIAADIIRPIHFLHDVIPLILYHHERWDGKGYPAGFKGVEIPIGARIIAIADAYQALTSNRPYRKAFSIKKAIEIIKKDSGGHFDPKIVAVFLNLLKKERKGKLKNVRKRRK